jgi:hypothetical protein
MTEETKAMAPTDEAVEKPEVLTEEEKTMLVEQQAKIDTEVNSIIYSLGIEDYVFEEEVPEGHTSANGDFYAEQLNIINEIRQTIGTIANRLMISLIGEFRLELEEVGIVADDLEPAVYNNTLQVFAQMYFDKNIDMLYDAAKGSDNVEESFCHAVTILSHTVGFSVKSKYIKFDLITTQVLHMMQKQFHTAYEKAKSE